MPWTFLSFQAERTVKMQTGDRTKHSGQNVCEYVKFVLKKNDIFFKFSNFPPPAAPVRPRRHRDCYTEAGCRDQPEEMAGDAAGDT
ncbi:unnamed protein product, partial [Staurois parvus]